MFSESCTALLKSVDETIFRLEETVGPSESELRWDRDMTAFLWHELPGDLPTSGWSVDKGETLGASSLALKAKGCTLTVKR